MDKIDEYLNNRADEFLMYKVSPNNELMDEIFSFDPRTVESVSGATISKYIIGLSQFLIYFSSQANKSKVLLMKKRRFLDLHVSQSSISGKTKAEKFRKVVDADGELQKVEEGIIALEQELTMLDSLDKYYLELINAFKKELGRKESELKSSKGF